MQGQHGRPDGQPARWGGRVMDEMSEKQLVSETDSVQFICPGTSFVDRLRKELLEEGSV